MELSQEKKDAIFSLMKTYYGEDSELPVSFDDQIEDFEMDMDDLIKNPVRFFSFIAEGMLNFKEESNENNIPKKEENPEGLYQKYVVQKTSGEPLDNNSEYFVLRLDEKGDKHHVDACRKAILVYANEIKEHIPKLSNDLIERYG